MNEPEQVQPNANEKSGQKMAKAGRSKTHPDFWKARLLKLAGGSDYSIRIQHAGRREWFNTRTANAVMAADKARRIYLDVIALGWVAAIAKHKPKAAPVAKIATVGAVILAASRVSTVRPNSLNGYASALRRLAAEISGMNPGSDTARFAHMRPEFKAYREQVDALPVDILTGSAVTAWKARVVSGKKTPVEQKSAAISCDSVIRSASALFGRKLRPFLEREVALPSPLPFAGITFGRTTRRFRPTVDAKALFLAAQSELSGSPEIQKAFALCFLAGLRRREADTLTWDQVDLQSGRLTIRPTAHFQPKSEESSREVDLSEEAVSILKIQKESSDSVFVLSGGPSKPLAKYKYYRADHAVRRGLPALRTWSNLLAWLRAKGVTDFKAIHSLRKHAGSLIHASYGLEVARDFLGHRDIATTAGSYVDKRPRVFVALP